MNVSELITLLQEYPGEMPVKIIHDHNDPTAPVFDFDQENILHTSENAFVDTTATEDEWDHEDGRVTQSGEQYLLINPIIF